MFRSVTGTVAEEDVRQRIKALIKVKTVSAKYGGLCRQCCTAVWSLDNLGAGVGSVVDPTRSWLAGSHDAEFPKEAH